MQFGGLKIKEALHSGIEGLVETLFGREQECVIDGFRQWVGHFLPLSGCADLVFDGFQGFFGHRRFVVQAQPPVMRQGGDGCRDMGLTVADAAHPARGPDRLPGGACGDLWLWGKARLFECCAGTIAASQIQGLPFGYCA
jgi:hypothetical protein